MLFKSQEDRVDAENSAQTKNTAPVVSVEQQNPPDFTASVEPEV